MAQESYVIVEVDPVQRCDKTQVADTFHVAIIEPCIHYCMGGLKVNEMAEVPSPTRTRSNSVDLP